MQIIYSGNNELCGDNIKKCIFRHSWLILKRRIFVIFASYLDGGELFPCVFFHTLSFTLSWHSTKENENQMNILSHACAQAHPKLPIICLFARVFYCSWRLGNKYLWKRQPATRFPLCLSTLIEVVKISLVIESIISSTQHSAFLRMYKTQL